MVTRFVNYYILPIDVNAVARQNVVITTFCNVTTFWVATTHDLFTRLYFSGVAIFSSVIFTKVIIGEDFIFTSLCSPEFTRK